ncbi:MAG: alpha/beta hydrolase [Verrucomicrobiota bacterium]
MKVLLAPLILALSACGVLPRSTPEPVPTRTAGSGEAKELVLFLPGRWSRVEEFEDEGFFEIARERWPKARLVAADLHLGYYRNQTGSKRLHEDIIAPARREGVETVRVVGISMGGLGGLIHDLQYPDDIDELFLLSPFVGEEEVIAEIEAAGGVRKWKGEPENERDFTRRLWRGLEQRWIKEGKAPEASLACGTEDRLVDSNRRFATDFLDQDRVLWRPGDHDWPTWRRLFGEMIKSPLRSR